MDGNGTPVRIRHFTDPGCPFAFSAERQRLRLRWLYGDQLAWSTHLVVLAEEPPDISPERLAAGRRTLHERYGMPMAWTPPPTAPVTVHACRAVVAARRHSEDACGALLRRLRVLCFAGGALDDPELIARAATEAGLDPRALAGWAASRRRRRRCATTCAPPAAPRPPPAPRTTSSAARRTSGATPAPATSWSAPRRTGGLAHGGARRPARLPPGRGVRGRDRQPRPRAGAPPGPRDRRGRARLGRDAARHRGGGRGVRPGIADVREQLAKVAGFTPVGGDGYWS